MQRNVLGVRIDDVSEEEAVALVRVWLEKGRDLPPQRDPASGGTSTRPHGSLRTAPLPRLVFTPGPEFILEASQDLEFKEILNTSNLNIPDGFGLKFAGIKNRIPGVDFMWRLCQEAEKNNWKIGLLGGWEGEGKATASKLKAIYPKVSIPLVIDGSEADNYLGSSRVQKINYPSVDILFVGMGHFKQEKLLRGLAICNQELATLGFRVGMGVGSSFDLISGRTKRPARIFTILGLEWLGRLARNPKHFGRVFKATVLFALLLLKKNLF